MTYHEMLFSYLGPGSGSGDKNLPDPVHIRIKLNVGNKNNKYCFFQKDKKGFSIIWIRTQHTILNTTSNIKSAFFRQEIYSLDSYDQIHKHD